jgi:Ca-activated chloride channel family protein
VDIDGVGNITDQSLSMIVAVDSSGSMTKNFPEVVEAVSLFAEDLLQTGDQAALIRFSSESEVLVSWSSDPEDIGRGLADVIPDGSTSLHDAIIHALMNLHNQRGRKALVLLTDGWDTSSFASFADTKWFSRSMRVPVFIIVLSAGNASFYAHGYDVTDVKHRHRLSTLARTSGGQAFFRVTLKQLPSIYAKIAGILRSQYVIWYRPDGADSDYRSIEVTVSDPHLKVRTISGYYSR